MKKEEFLKEFSNEELIQMFYQEFNYCSYVGELFEMIDEDKLRKWLINQFSKEFSLRELKELFEED